MTKTRDRKELARQLPRQPVVERRYVTMAMRPLRLAFVINSTTPIDELVQYLIYNSSIWGGIHNALVPTQGQSLDDDWWTILRDHDPDKVIFCGDISPDLVREVENRIQPYGVTAWSGTAKDVLQSPFTRIGSVPMRTIAWHVRQKEGPAEQSRLCVPAFDSRSGLRACIAAQIGVPTDELAEQYCKLLAAKALQFDKDSLESYLRGVSDLSGLISPLEMTRSYLSTSTAADSVSPGFHLVLCSSDSIDDYCLFWNLRAESSFIDKGKLLVPLHLLVGKRGLQALADWCNENVKGTNYLSVASSTADKRRIVRFRDRLRPLLAARFEFVDIWYDRFRAAHFRAHEAPVREEAILEDRVCSFKRPSTCVEQNFRSGMELVVDIDFEQRGRSGSAFIPPTHPKLTHVLCGSPPDAVVNLGIAYSVRMAHDQVSCRVSHSTDIVRVRLPDAEQLFTSVFQAYDYSTKLTDTHRYVSGMVNLLGSHAEAGILRTPGIRKLFTRMQDGSAYTVNEIMSILQPGALGHQTAVDIVADLALKGVLLRGYSIRCPACDLRRWYSLRDLGETMKCAGCLTSLQPSVEAPFHYRLNELVSRAVEQGAAPVLLTVLVLASLGRRSFMFLPSMQVSKERCHTEIDVLASCDGNLVLAECKDFRQGCSPETMGAVSDQLAGIVEVAHNVAARLVFLSVLSDAVPAELQRHVEVLQRQNPDVSIHTLVREDLDRGFVASKEVDNQGPASFADLIPRVGSRRSGWVMEAGKRAIYG